MITEANSHSRVRNGAWGVSGRAQIESSISTTMGTVNGSSRYGAVSA